MHGIVFRRLVRAQWLGYRALHAESLAVERKEPLKILEFELLTTFKKVAEPLSKSKGRGIGSINQYAFLTFRSLLGTIKKVADPDYSGRNIPWDSDYLPKLNKMKNDPSVSEEAKEIIGLWTTYFTVLKKFTPTVVGKGHTPQFYRKVKPAVELIATEAERLVSLQGSKQEEIRYILQPVRGQLAGFNLFSSIPVGHTEPFFTSYAAKDYHFKFILEDGDRKIKMIPTQEWAATKLKEWDFNMGQSGSFKTSAKNQFKTVRVIANLTVD